MPNYRRDGERVGDFPVFNGKYSTICYVDQVIAALDGMFAQRGGSRRDFYAELAAVLFHRPYQQLPVTALATALTFDIVRDDAAQGRLAELALAAGVDPSQVRAEVELHAAEDFDLLAAVSESGPDHDPFTAVTAVAKQLRGSPWFRELCAAKLGLGSDLVRDVGNLYTASLPAWLAAAFEDALTRGVELAGKSMLLVGYGSGDAAEAIPAIVVPGWERAAARIGFARALETSHALDREQYEALHDGRPVVGLTVAGEGFAVREVGALNDRAFADIGVEYYEYRAKQRSA
jgi:hydroxymethylglutaryl-CoA synthase